MKKKKSAHKRSRRKGYREVNKEYQDRPKNYFSCSEMQTADADIQKKSALKKNNNKNTIGVTV